MIHVNNHKNGWETQNRGNHRSSHRVIEKSILAICEWKSYKTEVPVDDISPISRAVVPKGFFGWQEKLTMLGCETGFLPTDCG